MSGFVIKFAGLWLIAIIGVLFLSWLRLPDFVNAPVLFVCAVLFMLALFRLCTKAQ